VDKELFTMLRHHVQPFFCLSWLITWFAHDIKDLRVLARMYDAFVVSHMLLPLYATVALITTPCVRTEIKRLFEYGHDTPEVYSYLQHVPGLISYYKDGTIPVDTLLSQTLDIYHLYPPHVLLSTETASALSDASMVWHGYPYPWYTKKENIKKGFFYTEQDHMTRALQQRDVWRRKRKNHHKRNVDYALKLLGISAPLVLAFLVYYYRFSSSSTNRWKSLTGLF